VVLFPAGLSHSNLGDIAMLKVAVRRIREFLPGAAIVVLTGRGDAAARLTARVPGVRPAIFDPGWFSERVLLGRLHDRLPAVMSGRLVGMKESVWRRSPALFRAVVGWRLGSAEKRRELDAFVGALGDASLVLATGAGGMNDVFPRYARMCLSTLALAQALGKVTGVLSQGLGPMRDTAALQRLGRVFNRLQLIALREEAASKAVLASAGVHFDRALFTGDDAIELAHEERQDGLGSALGINLRLAAYTGVDEGATQSLGPVLRALNRRLGARMLPLPISTRGEEDLVAAARVMGVSAASLPECVSGAGGPEQVVRLAGQCRVVVTGAYHAAVFALGQGVPVVCLAASEYYREKLSGLATQFAGGCEVIHMNGAQTMERVAAAADRLWHRAPDLRAGLLKTASEQIRAGREALAALAGEAGEAKRLVEARRLRPERSRERAK
jgi:colanic acid/amylovoran biosynthesis protein